MWSKGTETKLTGAEHLYEFTLETQDLTPGFYEIKRVGFHTPKEKNIDPDTLFFHSGKDIQRTFFEIISQERLTKPSNKITEEIISVESKFEEYFRSGISLSNDNSKKRYQVFTFVSGLFMSRVIRLGKLELIPFRGLDQKDYFDLVNDFFNQDLYNKLSFNYTAELSREKRNKTPVCVIHFPTIFSESGKDAKTFSYQESLLLTELLSVYRGGSGSVFALAVHDLSENSTQLYTEDLPYIGNLLGGSIAGENPDSIKDNFQKLKIQPTLRYYLSLFKEARAELNIDFQYLRYWQILEMIAESKNFKRSKPLTDFRDIPILNKKGEQIKIKRKETRVYELIKQHYKVGGIAEPNHKLNHTEYDLWKFIKGWYGMRNAAAHHGGFRYEDSYQTKNFGSYEVYEKVYNDQNRNNGGFVLKELIETSKLIIAREVNLS